MFWGSIAGVFWRLGLHFGDFGPPGSMFEARGACGSQGAQSDEKIISQTLPRVTLWDTILDTNLATIFGDHLGDHFGYNFWRQFLETIFGHHFGDLGPTFGHFYRPWASTGRPCGRSVRSLSSQRKNIIF